MKCLGWLWCVGLCLLLTVGCGDDGVAAGGSGGMAGTGGAGGTSTPRGLTVQTAEGAVQGVEQDGVHVFQGVPFAAPPVGDLRWKPPAPAPARTETLVADARGNPCIQDILILGETGDEDCLFLNVATPATGEDLPVMVWIHGGGFTVGEGAQTDGGTLGDKIARDTDTVVVTINYRLGPFGFLAHSTLTAESSDSASGNYGLMDQTAALQWVRDNIAGFGGDPNNVTIFGESAGAFSVCAHLASPLSAGLFHKAIAQSGSCQRPWASLALGESQGDTFANRLGCGGEADVLACMRGKTQSEVLNAFPAGPNFGFGDLEQVGSSWGPILDGLFTIEQFVDSVSSGNFNQVPTIYGFTKDEGQLFTWLSEIDMVNPIPITDDNYDDFVSLFLGHDVALVDQALAQYPTGSYAAPAQALGAFATDTIFRCPARDDIALLSQNVTTYLYQFEYTEAAFQLDSFAMRPEYGLGAFHSAEIQYIFGVPASIAATEFAPGADEDLWRAMLGYWTRFAATGDPNGDGAPSWPEWTTAGDDHLVFDTTIAASTGAAATECAFWADKDYLIPQL